MQADRAATAGSSAAVDRAELLPQAERHLEFARQSCSVGQSNALFLFDAQPSQLDARRGYVETRLELAMALAELGRSVGLPVGELLEGRSPAP